MTGPNHYLACDLGAESGRLMLGRLEGKRLTLQEIHRFPNTPIRAGESLHWNIAALCSELKAGLKKAAALKVPIASISTDSWGLDYVLLDEAGRVMDPTFCYRDPRTAKGVANVQARVDWPTIFAETGIQNMPINTLYQLAAEDLARLQSAKTLLGIGDFFNWFLCGRAAAEVSLASTFQLYNPRTGDWSRRLFDALGLPASVFPPIVPSGTCLGPLLPDVVAETSLSGVEVIASCSHDTGAAVAAVPVSAQITNPKSPIANPLWAYISSGTWSLMGVEIPAPILTDAARELNFTNEIGHGNSVRLLKNIIGLWLVQECRRHWAAQGNELSYAELTRLASEAEPFRSLINPSDARFLPPGDMPGRIVAFCREAGQPVPETPGQFVRCALESLALLYRKTLIEVELLMSASTAASDTFAPVGTRSRVSSDCADQARQGRLGSRPYPTITRLHIIGGGSQNTLLNQFTANACGIPVIAGPTEATSIGNILVQAIALGHVASLDDARQIVRDSFPVTHVEPQDSAAWEAAFTSFEKIVLNNQGTK